MNENTIAVVASILIARNASVVETGPDVAGSCEIRRASVVAARGVEAVAGFWGVSGLALSGLAVNAALRMTIEPAISDINTTAAPEWDAAWEAEARRAAESIVAEQPKAVAMALGRHVGEDLL